MFSYQADTPGIRVTLSKNDTLVLKAIAIFLVVGHNFFHFLPPVAGENEMVFSPEHIRNVLSFVLANPLDMLHPVFSFFGHYGVHIFIFLSAYGLTKKCLSMKTQDWKALYAVSVNKIFKVVKLTLLGLVFLCAYKALVLGDALTGDFFLKYLKFLTFTENLRPGKLYYFVSVWWFLALIVQFYLLFPLIYRLATKASDALFFAICAGTILISAASYSFLLEHQIYVYATPLGQFSVFALGAYLATGKAVPKVLALALLLLLPFSFAYETLFHVSFVAIVLSAVIAYERFLSQKLSGNALLLWFGQLSMYVYIVHGDLRWMLINRIENIESLFLNYVVFGGFFLEVVFFAYLCSLVAKRVALFR